MGRIQKPIVQMQKAFVTLQYPIVKYNNSTVII